MTCAVRTFFLVFLCCIFAASADADESRPAHLQLTLTDLDNVSMVFKVPALGDRRLGLYPKLPANCEAAFPPSGRIVDNAYTERATFRCAGGLVGETIFIDGLSSTFTEVLARVIRPDGATQVARLTPSAPSFIVEATPNALAVVSSYLQFGFAHILSGFDHLLFVLALLILVPSTRILIWTITAFARVDAAQTMDRRIYVRTVARIWLCRCVNGSWTAGTIDTARAAVFQCGSRTWPAGFRCCCPCVDRNSETRTE